MRTVRRLAASALPAAGIIGVGRDPISSTVNLSRSTNLKTTLWTLAGGYTLATGEWGHVEALRGFRYLGVEARTDHDLAVTLVGPRGDARPTLGGTGLLSGRDDIWNGVVGVRGRINIAQNGFFVPDDLTSAMGIRTSPGRPSSASAARRVGPARNLAGATCPSTREAARSSAT